MMPQLFLRSKPFTMSAVLFPGSETARLLAALRQTRPLVHCLTNEVVQEITANALLAAGASPAMVVAEEEAPYFAGIASALLINIGTPYPSRLRAMHTSVDAAIRTGRPWVLDPVAAGGIPWRDGVIRTFVEKKPSVIRGNASEILTLAGMKSGGRGVDSTDSSDAAAEAAASLARQTQGVVCVTGETDYVTDGTEMLSISGGTQMTTLVVGTGCSLSALVAAFCGASAQHLQATAAACALAKKAADTALPAAKGPGSFHSAYLDALYSLQPEDFLQ